MNGSEPFIRVSLVPRDFSTSRVRIAMRRYPPLLTILIALLIAFLVLPSALTLPQANPSTVLEYAPVPPDDDTPPPPQDGSISQLGLGSTSSLSTGLGTGPGAGRSILGPVGSGDKPITKRCVGTPLRQTEDPNSPPCVPYFEGDNGGPTWQGVTSNEINVIIYQSAFISDQNETEFGDTSAGEQTPSGTYCDLDLPSEAQEDCRSVGTDRELSLVTGARALSRFFNERFQTYNRHVHMWIYWSGASSPSGRKAEAAANWKEKKPFAVVNQAIFGGYESDYVQAITTNNTMVFGGLQSLPQQFYQSNAPNFWTFWPDVEHWADMYASYVCQKVAPVKTAVHAGGDLTGKPRKYAIMRTTDPSYPNLKLFADLVTQKIKGCVEITTTVHFPYAGFAVCNSCGNTYGVENVAKMRDAGVTTVLWLGGMEAKTTAAADASRWHPEWVVAGDRTIDTMLNGRWQNQNAWRYAWTVSHTLREGKFADTPARQAYREADPGGRQIVEYWATLMYQNMFQFFKAVQVAGPQLNPQTIDQGFHAIQRKSSPDPFVAACFYDSGDYSCVKDSHEAWWDPNAPDPNGESGIGCYRMVSEGRRYLSGEWAPGDLVFKNPQDTCNGFKGSVQNMIP